MSFQCYYYWIIWNSTWLINRVRKIINLIFVWHFLHLMADIWFVPQCNVVLILPAVLFPTWSNRTGSLDSIIDNIVIYPVTIYYNILCNITIYPVTILRFDHFLFCFKPNRTGNEKALLVALTGSPSLSLWAHAPVSSCTVHLSDRSRAV